MDFTLQSLIFQTYLVLYRVSEDGGSNSDGSWLGGIHGAMQDVMFGVSGLWPLLSLCQFWGRNGPIIRCILIEVNCGTHIVLTLLQREKMLGKKQVEKSQIKNYVCCFSVNTSF